MSNEIQEQITRLTSFDPNAERVQLWASYVPSRSPKFRVFHRRVDVVNSVRNSNGRTGTTYFLVGGDWELYEVWVDGKELYR